MEGGRGEGRIERSLVRRATLAVAVAASLFAATGTVAELGPDALSPRSAGVWRAVIGGAVLLGWMWLREPSVRLSRRHIRWMLLGGVAVAGYQLTFFDAVARTGVAVGTLITIGTGPVVAGVIDGFVNRRAPTGRWVTGAVAATVGVSVLTLDAPDIDLAGVVLAVVAGTMFPIYGLAAQRLMHDLEAVTAIGVVFGSGALMLAPLAVGSAGEAFSSLASIVTIGFLGIFTLALAYLLWGVGLRHLSLGIVVVVTLLEPAVASLLGVAVLGEPFTIALLGGIFLVGIGVLYASTEKPAAGTV